MAFTGNSKRSYTIISEQVRKEVVRSIQDEKLSTLQASKKFGLKLSSIRSIIRVFKSEGRTNKQKIRRHKVQLVVGIRLVIQHPVIKFDQSPLLIEQKSYQLNKFPGQTLDESTFKNLSLEQLGEVFSQIRGACQTLGQDRSSPFNRNQLMTGLLSSLDQIEGQDQLNIKHKEVITNFDQNRQTQGFNLIQQLMIRQQYMIQQQQQYFRMVSNQQHQQQNLRISMLQQYLLKQQQANLISNQNPIKIEDK